MQDIACGMLHARRTTLICRANELKYQTLIRDKCKQCLRVDNLAVCKDCFHVYIGRNDLITCRLCVLVRSLEVYIWAWFVRICEQSVWQLTKAN